MNDAPKAVPARIIAKRAYTLDEAEEAYGINKKQLQRHRALGLITFTYPNRYPIIREKHMEEYLDRLPTIHV